MIDIDKRRRFLEHLEKGFSVTMACKSVGIARSTVYAHRKANADFAAEWEDAVEAGIDLLEDEALRRAKDGTERPVYHQGVQVGTIREYSDRLLELLLRARRPEKYRERHEVRHAGHEGGPLIPKEVGEAVDALFRRPA